MAKTLSQPQSAADKLDAQKVVLATPDLKAIEPVKQRLRRLLSGTFGIAHCTLEIEHPQSPVHDTEIVAEH